MGMPFRRRSPGSDREMLRGAIRDKYADVALDVPCTFHLFTGTELVELLEYGELLEEIPQGAIDRFVGVGNPFRLGPIIGGEVVLDVGAGAGMDALIAARKTGRRGQVIGIDITREMVGTARRHAREAGARNVRFEQGFAEAIPMPDDSVDVLISNGVFNLCPGKVEVFRELLRVLRPGGRLQIADILIERPFPRHLRDTTALWTDCVAGASTVCQYADELHTAGFREIDIVRSYDIFRDAPTEGRARQHGARGYGIQASKSSNRSSARRSR